LSAADRRELPWALSDTGYTLTFSGSHQGTDVSLITD
jgi:hypothetical protein